MHLTALSDKDAIAISSDIMTVPKANLEYDDQGIRILFKYRL